jgi:hypothetical protein
MPEAGDGFVPRVPVAHVGAGDSGPQAQGPSRAPHLRKRVTQRTSGSGAEMASRVSSSRPHLHDRRCGRAFKGWAQSVWNPRAITPHQQRGGSGSRERSSRRAGATREKPARCGGLSPLRGRGPRHGWSEGETSPFRAGAWPAHAWRGTGCDLRVKSRFPMEWYSGPAFLLRQSPPL